MSTNSNTDWTISTDIYKIVESVDNLKKRYIADEDETTLALGIFGFIGDTEAKKIQTAAIMSSELSNEMFPARAKLDKNITTHAIYCNIDNMNAKPSYITLNIAIKESDLDTYMNDNEFIFDKTCPINIGDYEFHLDYDIILERNKKPGMTKYVYTARYDMDDKNNISDINVPYLKQPFYMNFNNYTYVFFQATARQVTLEETTDKMITSSIIDNKSFTFNFSNQLADFDVYVTDNGVTKRLKPLFYGSAIETGLTNYCWYLYMNESTIRIGFDQNSYIPGLNTTVTVKAKTTLGAVGNFSYKDTTEDEDTGIYVDFESKYYNYKKITCYVTCATDAVEGSNKKSIEELQQLIPKMAMSRGYVTTETDLNNYFNLISNTNNRLKLQEKVDNQLNRIWYAYFLIKDQYNNVVPTNTIPIKIDLKSSFVKQCIDETGRYIIPCGTTFIYDPTVGYAVGIDEGSIPAKYSTEYFEDKYYYRSIYNIVINIDPLYCAYYMTLVNLDGFFEYNYVNDNCNLGFVANTNHFERSLLTRRNQYRFNYTIIQSVNEDFGLYKIDNTSGTNVITTNMKCFLVLYKDGAPYRYTPASLKEYDGNAYASKWEVTLETDDGFDNLNRLKLLNLGEPGFTTTNYGYFEDDCEAYLYIYGKFDQEYGRDDADKIIPEMTGYSLVNIYKVASGLQLFKNFTSVINTRIRANVSEDLTAVNYDISGIPMVGEHFFTSEDNATYFMKAISNKKAYIDSCLKVLENSMDIDFKLFNTYGYSKTYVMGDAEETSINHIDITMKFRVQLTNSSDLSTKNSIVQYIKEYIEDLNELGDLHIPNLIHDIKEEFGDLIHYIEYINFNNVGLGVNHIILREIQDAHIVPEFITIRNKIGNDGTTLVPCIDMEVVL